ncbi:MAG: flavodoxin family protein [Deltaproteobacteria bacterium]|nr:flavodoxin family protein [Deltaproteobacteria bacterium]
MKEIVALIGSPRKLGNSELMAKEICRHLRVACHLTLVRLPAMNIQPCRACYACIMAEKKCPLDDDLPKILAALVQADAVILSVPTYMLSANASLKRLLDRGLSFLANFQQLWQKPAVAVAIAGIAGMEGYCKLCLDSAARLMGLHLKGSEVVYGALPGEIFLDQANRKVAASLASALFADAPAGDNPRWCCPACGGDTFRFLSADTIRCMTCSSPGKVRIENGSLHMEVNRVKDHFFLSVEGAQKHLKWLQQMKQRFLEQKKTLKAICTDYMHQGDWLASSKEHEDGQRTAIE